MNKWVAVGNMGQYGKLHQVPNSLSILDLAMNRRLCLWQQSRLSTCNHVNMQESKTIYLYAMNEHKIRPDSFKIIDRQGALNGCHAQALNLWSDYGEEIPCIGSWRDIRKCIYSARHPSHRHRSAFSLDGLPHIRFHSPPHSATITRTKEILSTDPNFTA